MKVPSRSGFARGPGFGPRNERLEASSAFTAPVHVLDHAELPEASDLPAERKAAGPPVQGGLPLESVSAEARKEACGAAILLGKLLAVCLVLLCVVWSLGLWHLRQRDAVQVSHLQAQLAAAESESARLLAEHQELRSVQLALRHEKDDAERRAFDATSELGDRQGVINELEEDLQSSDGLAEKLQEELANGAVSWRQGLEESQRMLVELRRKVTSGEKQVLTQQGEISKLLAQLQAVQKQYNESSAAFRTQTQDGAKQQQLLQQKQKELQRELKAAKEVDEELRRQLKDAQRDHGLRLREAAHHEAKAVLKAQEQVKSNEDFIQKLLHRLATNAKKQEEGEAQLATLRKKLQSKEQLAKEVAQSLQHLLDNGEKSPPKRHRRLKIK